ncbi:MAG TPA: hypothetical protein VFY13_09880 [Luteolibacter sp.]|nr:hypothetical protein [Luteolibacter sp.]
MKSSILCALVVSVLGLSACRKDRQIKVYTVEPPPAAPEQAADPHGAHGGALPPVAPASGQAEADPHMGMAVLKAPEFKDEAPAHWEKKPATAMRMASYKVSGEDGAEADISFTSLRSVPGSRLANLNRWRQQVGKQDLSEEEMARSVEIKKSFFGDAVLIDVEGLLEKDDPKKDGRIIGALAEKDGRAWFYKMRGNAALVGREKENFIRWIASLSPLESVPAVPAVVTPSALTWTLPDGWVAQYGSESRYATVRVPKIEGVELAVSWFPGDVGGDVANVNRWRSQVGLDALGEQEALALIQKIEAGPKTLSLVDLAGPEKRMLAAWARHGENTWFFKLTGAKDSLDACKQPFSELVASVRFNSPAP